jgi:adenylate cyclase
MALSLLTALFMLRLWDPEPVESIRLTTFDYYQVIQPREASQLPVVIIDIDEKSLAEIGQWPWPRTVLADLVAKLAQLGALCVAFDVVFAEPDRLSPANLAKSLPGLPAEAAEAIAKLRGGDELFASVIKQAPVVLGRAALPYGQGDTTAPVRTTPAALLSAPGAAGVDPRQKLLRFGGIVRNVPLLEESSPGLGIFMLAEVRDTVVRRVPMVIVSGDQIFPSLSVEMLRVATRQSAYAIRSDEAGVESIRVGPAGQGGVQIPTDDRGRVWVHFAKSDPLRYVSAADVLAGRVPPHRIARRFTIVGTSAAGLLDIKATAVGRSMPGVEVHAQLLEQILQQIHPTNPSKPLARPNWALAAELALVAVSGLIVIVLLPMAGAWWALGVGVIGLLALGGVAWHLYATEGLLIDLSYPVFVTFSLYLLLTFIGYVQEEGRRRHIRAAFSRYLSPKLVARLADDPSLLKIGGEEREMTLLFSDVKGFSRIAENYDAARLTTLINRLLNPLTNAILEQDGTVDKYMGDAIMAFWNAPLDEPQHARKACYAAIEIQKRIGPVNEEIRAECEAAGAKYMPLAVGVGLNSGTCCVGNMGSDLQMNYSVLGDDVNVASRLEGQTRSYAVDIVVGETTQAGAPDLAYLELDLIRVTGKNEPVRIFALLGREDLAADPKFRALREAHAAMLAAYRAQDWDAARNFLARARALGSELDLNLGGMYDVYASRIDEFSEVPPAPDWDTVYVATGKH